MITTVFFDLDDTIYDHKYSRLSALNALIIENSFLRSVPVEALEAKHARLLQAYHKKVINAQMPEEEARISIIRELLQEYTVNMSDIEAKRHADLYRSAYMNNRRAIPGVLELIRLLGEQALLGIVSNGLLETQLEKVMFCGLDGLFDFYVFSEEIETMKPSRAIFDRALLLCGSEPSETAMIGDSWGADILGATRFGIQKVVWLSRYGQPCPDPSLVFEIRDYSDPAGLLAYLRSPVGAKNHPNV